ncbi:hypothetical protein [Litoribacillus peritrichatus]|uniref:Uncharacterized protein n=1 Tax=Litoribacillus peritrichatus TaxID=718191 RepID=A0ABP7N0E8_9GAMM
MIEKDLVGSNFLIPRENLKIDVGYISRDEYCNALKRGAVIGVYNAQGKFIEDKQLTVKYAEIIPEIAEALTKDPRSTDYRRFKLAALEKGNLLLRLEWEIAKAMETNNISLELGRLMRNYMGFTTLLVDMGGPSYEVVTADSVDTTIEMIKLDEYETAV